MHFTSSLITFLPLMASLAIAAPLTESNLPLKARTALPKECSFLNDHKMLCVYTSSNAAAAPVVKSNIPDACKPDLTGASDIVCKLPAGAKGFSLSHKRDVAAEAYKFSLVCDATGCHTGNVARDVAAVEAEAYKFEVVVELKKRDEVAIAERAVAAPAQEAYKFSVTVEI
ncbi:hypothetical protein HYFRA_00003651 [Hymenoscyphus fraxineus]|uniref:Uncharacterized protein n=1 Tax=Hymenoscyphus fraxineus TaxID=746836 RepID=A0A9N9PQX8_9HELO|nr:hypothetical protein HYFRA_00003651 [Hymenoscyphus fraxineus]